MKLSKLMLISLMLLAQNKAFAASEAECGIWLCIPTGFGEGCSEPFDAFIDRIKDFKPPLVSISSCVALGKTVLDSMTDDVALKNQIYAQSLAESKRVSSESGDWSDYSHTLVWKERNRELELNRTDDMLNFEVGERKRFYTQYDGNAPVWYISQTYYYRLLKSCWGVGSSSGTSTESPQIRCLDKGGWVSVSIDGVQQGETYFYNNYY